MTRAAVAALRDGIARVAGAPWVLIGACLVVVITSVVPALVMRTAIARHLGDSLEADAAADGVNYDWMEEFNQPSESAAGPLSPDVVGYAAVLDHLSAFMDNERQPTLVMASGGVTLVFWYFITGGILDRYARQRRTGASEFFSASRVFFFRFLRLGLLAFLPYAFLFGVVHGWLFETIYEGATSELTVERTAFVVRLAMYLVFGAMLAAVNILFDYAKVRAVVEDRRSMIASVLAAGRFLARHGTDAVPLYLMNLVIAGCLLASYVFIAPGAGSSGWSMWAGLLVAEGFVLARTWTKLLFWAAEVALFQRLQTSANL